MMKIVNLHSVNTVISWNVVSHMLVDCKMVEDFWVKAIFKLVDIITRVVPAVQQMT